MTMKRTAAQLLVALSTGTVLLGLVPLAHAATPESIQFYSSPGHPAATARGATSIASCTASDTCGLALKFDTRTVGTITATARSLQGVAAVIEDKSPQYGGLGVIGTTSASGDNIGRGERLTLKFDRIVDLQALTFFDSQHLTDFYKSNTGNASFRLDVVNNGALTTGVYDLTNHFNPGTAFVGNEFTFIGLKNDLTVGNSVEHFSFYVGGFDVATHVTVVPPKPPVVVPPKPPVVVPPKPPTDVPEPESIALFAGAMLAMAAVRRRRQR